MWKSDEMILEDIDRHRDETKRGLDAVDAVSRKLDSLDEEIEASIELRRKRADIIYECWSGPAAYRDFEEELAACDLDLQEARRASEQIRENVRNEERHLRSSKENLDAEAERIKRLKKEDHNV